MADFFGDDVALLEVVRPPPPALTSAQRAKGLSFSEVWQFDEPANKWVRKGSVEQLRVTELLDRNALMADPFQMDMLHLEPGSLHKARVPKGDGGMMFYASAAEFGTPKVRALIANSGWPATQVPFLLRSELQGKPVPRGVNTEPRAQEHSIRNNARHTYRNEVKASKKAAKESLRSTADAYNSVSSSASSEPEFFVNSVASLVARNVQWEVGKRERSADRVLLGEKTARPAGYKPKRRRVTTSARKALKSVQEEAEEDNTPAAATDTAEGLGIKAMRDYEEYAQWSQNDLERLLTDADQLTSRFLSPQSGKKRVSEIKRARHKFHTLEKAQIAELPQWKEIDEINRVRRLHGEDDIEPTPKQMRRLKKRAVAYGSDDEALDMQIQNGKRYVSSLGYDENLGVGKARPTTKKRKQQGAFEALAAARAARG